MEIRHFKLIVAVARLGSLTKASNELFLSQPALSHQLREIEEELGVKVFKRENNKMVLTEVGEVIKNHSEESLKIVESLHKNLNGLKGNSSSIKLCIQNYNSYHWIGSIIEKFNEKFNEIEIEIITESTKKPLELIKDDKLDLAIMHKCPLDQEFHIKQLFTDELVVVVNNNHPLSRNSHIELNDLEDETIILNTIKGQDEQLISSLINLDSIHFKRIMYMNLTDNIIHMVRSGFGISILPKWIICPFTDSNIKCLPITKESINVDWFIIHKEETEPTQFLIDTMRQSLNQVVNSEDQLNPTT